MASSPGSISPSRSVSPKIPSIDSLQYAILDEEELGTPGLGSRGLHLDSSVCGPRTSLERTFVKSHEVVLPSLEAIIASSQSETDRETPASIARSIALITPPKRTRSIELITPPMRQPQEEKDVVPLPITDPFSGSDLILTREVIRAVKREADMDEMLENVDKLWHIPYSREHVALDQRVDELCDRVGIAESAAFLQRMYAVERLRPKKPLPFKS